MTAPADLVNEELCRRVTWKYVGTFAHLDHWQRVGDMRELSRQTISEPSDEPEDHRRVRIMVLVDPADETNLKGIEAALADHYTAVGCACEHDCCGCRSYMAGKVEHVSDHLWLVEVSSWRNY